MQRKNTENLSSEKKEFIRRIRFPFGIALLLTGFFSVMGTISVIRAFLRGFPNGGGSAFWIAATPRLVFLASMLCAFAALIKAALDSRPFSKTLAVCMKIISVLYLALSFGLPRISGYNADFQIFGNSKVTLLDGTYLMVGVLLWLLAAVLRVGFEQQNDLDHTL